MLISKLRKTLFYIIINKIIYSSLIRLYKISYYDIICIYYFYQAISDNNFANYNI